MAAAILVAGACTNDADNASPPGSGDPDGGFLGLRGSAPVVLQSERDCDAVLEDLQDFAAPVLADQLFGFGGGRDVIAEEALERTGAAAADGDDAASASAEAPLADTTAAVGEGGGTSDTNVQEAGIDEPDVVETDGDFVYLVDQDALVILDGATAEVLSRTSLGTHGAQLLLQGDRLLAITGGGHGFAVGGPAIAVDDVATVEVAPEPAPDELEPDEEPAPPPEEEPVPVEPGPAPTEPQWYAGTTIQLLDVSDRTAPTVVETTEIEGNHISTRVVEGVARVVVSSWPQPAPMTDPAVLESAMADLEAADGVDRDEAVAAIATAVEETSIDDWLPSYRTTSPDATSIEGPLVGCEDVWVPEINAGITETSVLRVGFDEGFDPAETTTIVAEANTVYASASTLYLAANRYVPLQDQESFGEEFSTAIQAFDLRGGGAATHLGAGAIPGHVLNQYSLSEHEGYLRVASTEGAPWNESDPSQSGVRVLQLDDGELVEVGAVTGLGVTETIQSVRFIGNVGYVVTFRQTDPLYVIDLSDPTAPEAVGELKIPGFSSYLHPISEDRLIGIGRDADLEGRDQGLLVSLFDVSDPTAPEQLQTYTERDAWSAAGNDPKAFLWWAPENALAIPVERYGTRVLEPEPAPAPDEPQQDPQTDEGEREIAVETSPVIEDFEIGITVLDVSDDAIVERGTVTHDGRWASRALVVQDRLWSLFDGAVAVSDFADVESATIHEIR